jgi:hypothetical protein
MKNGLAIPESFLNPADADQMSVAEQDSRMKTPPGIGRRFDFSKVQRLLRR